MSELYVVGTSVTPLQQSNEILRPNIPILVENEEENGLSVLQGNLLWATKIKSVVELSRIFGDVADSLENLVPVEPNGVLALEVEFVQAFEDAHETKEMFPNSLEGTCMLFPTFQDFVR